MLEAIWHWVRAVRRRARRLERREVRELRRWLEDTENVLHLSALVVLPFLIGLITWLSNVSPVVSFLVYPPLASGTYTLFADPGGRYSSPRTFVGGMTVGAISGWIALEFSARFLYTVSPAQFQVHAGAAALGIFLTAITTWSLDLEQPAAFSTALLVLVTGSEELTYVVGIVVASAIVAGAFLVWRQRFYQERSRYLFQSTSGDDQVLVPIREGHSESIALLAARLAAAHEAGKVVLMESVPEEEIQQVEAEMAAERSTSGAGGATEIVSNEATTGAQAEITDEALARLERIRGRISSAVDVPCEYVVVVEDGSTGETILQTAAAENCDLIVAPYETDNGDLAGYVRTLLTGETDTIVYRPSNGRAEWNRILVMIRASGRIANAMLDFAERLVSAGGRISACSCVSKHAERRSAEILLENVVESLSVPVEMRIEEGSAEAFLETNAPHYDLAVIGASTDRTPASRFVSTPTFERLPELECDLAIVHRQ